MARQGYDLELRRYDRQGWRAMFFPEGFEHSLTAHAGARWALSPWAAVQQAAHDTLAKLECLASLRRGTGRRQTSRRREAPCLQPPATKAINVRHSESLPYPTRPKPGNPQLLALCYVIDSPRRGTVATTSVAEMIRKKLDAGTLPHDSPAKLWAGIGSGKCCTACEQPILESEPEYEPQYDDGHPVLRFHARCHSVWDEERQRAHERPNAAAS
jgi:hypothetical protein